jgi:hypothetical protein
MAATATATPTTRPYDKRVRSQQSCPEVPSKDGDHLTGGAGEALVYCPLASGLPPLGWMRQLRKPHPGKPTSL